MCKSNRLFISLLSLLLLFSVKNAFAQKDAVWGSWVVGNVEYGFTPKLYGYVELQERNQEVLQHFFYYEVKGGIGYRIRDNFSALIGFGNYGTYDWEDLSAPKVTDEWRVWEQFVMTQSLQCLKFEHRLRAEQALINKKYRNRFRYRLNLTVPLNKPAIQKGVWFASVFDEIFLTDHAPYFMRNRVYAGLGYQVSAALSISLGWVNQFNYNLTTAGGKNNLMMLVAVRLPKK